MHAAAALTAMAILRFMASPGYSSESTGNTSRLPKPDLLLLLQEARSDHFFADLFEVHVGAESEVRARIDPMIHNVEVALVGAVVGDAEIGALGEDNGVARSAPRRWLLSTLRQHEAGIRKAQTQ